MRIVATDLGCASEAEVDRITAAAVDSAARAWLADNGDRVALILAEQAE